jgi:GT2 family glycosyltransferase
MIPTLNGRALLGRALRALQRQELAADVCVIDNGSADGTATMVESDFPGTRLIRFNSNQGFGRAINEGARTSSADLVVSLNNDAEPDPAFVLEIAESYTHTRPEMIAACLRQEDGSIDSLGVEIDSSLWAYDVARGDTYGLPSHKGLEPLAPTGGAAAYRRDAFLDLGGFDEQIVAYLEDVELGIRMRMAGMRCALAYRSFAWHRHSATLGSGSTEKNRLMGSSRGYLIWRHGSNLSARERFRGFVGDLVVYSGQMLIDRNMGSVRGRLERHRALRGSQRPKPSEKFGLVPRRRVPLWRALGLRLGRRT